MRLTSLAYALFWLIACGDTGSQEGDTGVGVVDAAAETDASEPPETEIVEAPEVDEVAPDVEEVAPDVEEVAPIALRILAFNDFHGALEAGPAPGVELLAGAIADQRDEGTVVVAAGDLIGGSPLMSALFHDEPTIEVMNAIGLDYVAVGNHEFDEGAAELLRMQHGGCHPVDGCVLRESFAGASFQYLAANVRYRETGEPLLPGYALHEALGVMIAFVGMTLENTPAATLASGIEDLTFADEVEAMNALVPELQASGADLIVLLLHQGGRQTGGPNECLGLTGSIRGIVQALDPAVSIVLSGHSHASYVCRVGDKLLTSAGANGSHLTVIDVAFDPVARAVVEAAARNLPVADTETRDARVAELIEEYDVLVAPLRDAVIAMIDASITRVPSPSGEAALGSVIADAMLSATRLPAKAAAEAALMNISGIRASLEYDPAGEELPGEVTYGEAFRVQPFSNLVSTVSMTGRDLLLALESSCRNGRPFQVAGLTFRWDPAAPPGARVSLLRVDGARLDEERVYRVTVNSIVVESLMAQGLLDTSDVEP